MTSPLKLIVVMAFDKDPETGVLGPAFEAREYPDEERARRAARELSQHHAGVIAWSRTARPDIGEFGEPVELFRAGEIPEME